MPSARLAALPLVLIALTLTEPGVLAGTPGSAAAAPSGWIDQVRHGLQQQEYELTWQGEPVVAGLGAAWHAPNRAHGLRSYFAQEGIHVVDRTQESPSWVWSLSFAGYGRGTSLWPVQEARLSVVKNRIEYSRGIVEEWYVNDPRGIEQGFVLKAPPEEAAMAAGAAPFAGQVAPPGRARDMKPDSLIHLDMDLDGELMPVVSGDGQAIDFVVPGGARVLRYAELVVTDARGKALQAWMEGVVDEAVRGIRLVFDDADAVYPITIDPLATSPAWTSEANQISALLGAGVGTAGDVNADGYADVIVGAYGFDNGEVDEGRAFVYLGSASGLSTSPAWIAESNQAGARFGFSVGTAGDVDGDGYADVVVGAQDFDNGETDEGRAFVYMGSAAGLSPAPAWTAESDQTAALFGRSAGTAGDVNSDGFADVIVGARFYDNGQINEGRAFVYLGSSSGLSSSPSWWAEGDQADANFAREVRTAGDVNGDGYADVIVGADTYDNVEADEGRAFVYLGSASGLSSSPVWTAESDHAGALFGFSVGTAGDVNGDGYADVVVGAYNFDNGESDEGRLFAYLGSATGPSASPSWIVESDTSPARLGVSVGTAGDVNGDGYADVIAGAYLFNSGQGQEGAAFVYLGSASGLPLTPSWFVESNQSGSFFGTSVGTAGDVNGDGYADVIVGALAYDNGEDDVGRAFVYLGSPSGPATIPGWAAEGSQAGASLGISVGAAGDVNGDGYADVIVGAHQYDNGQSNEGAAFVYPGSASGLSPVAAWMAEGDQSSANFGNSVKTAGDVDGNGYADVIVGAWLYDNGQTDEGRAFVYMGSASGLSASPSWTAESNLPVAYFGGALNTAGDVNGDGYDDVVVGAYQVERAYVYMGSASGLSVAPAWSVLGDQAGAYFGIAVGTAGDVNADGYDDVLVGAAYYDVIQPDNGRAFCYLGSATGLSPSFSWSANGVPASARYGHALGTAGDVNGDGYADVIVGAFLWDEGRALAYHGSSTGLSTGHTWAAGGSFQAGSHFGVSAGTAGDVDGDGFSDVIVGAWAQDNGQVDEGRAYLYRGSAAGLSLTPAWSAESDQANAYFGYSAEGAGDVNGDGYSDVIVGSHLFDNPEADEGRAFVYYGNGGAGLSLKPQQRRADDLGAICRGGRSRTPGSFRLAALGRTPFGRSEVKLEWEVKRRGQLFNGTGTQRSTAWQDTGAAGSQLNESVSGLEPGGYHWRVRFLYSPATSPFQQASRWLSVPWNGSQERDLAVSPFYGGAVWDDRDRDGIRDASEPPLPFVQVELLDTGGSLLKQTLTDIQGEYRFELSDAAVVRVRFIPLTGYQFTTPDQGVDDTLDSDADTVTGRTGLIGPLHQSLDATSWSAGLVARCVAPDEPIFIYNLRLGPGNSTILDFQDGNQFYQVTGYHVYRSSDASIPRGSWPRVATNVVDMDAATPNLQWADTSGDVSPTGIWYYDITAYSSICNAEGPF